MYWYHWLAAYMVGIGGFLFYIVINKTWWMWGIVAFLITVGLLIIFKTDTKKQKEERIKEG